jgi:hypothetical protein
VSSCFCDERDQVVASTMGILRESAEAGKIRCCLGFWCTLEKVLVRLLLTDEGWLRSLVIEFELSPSVSIIGDLKCRRLLKCLQKYQTNSSRARQKGFGLAEIRPNQEAFRAF